MSRPCKSLFLCQHCGDRITHAHGIRVAPALFFCGAPCLRKSVKAARKRHRQQLRRASALAG